MQEIPQTFYGPPSKNSKSHKGFIVKYSLAILIPLAFLIIYQCYDKGTYRSFGQVTINHTWSYMDSRAPFKSSVRGNGTVGRSYSMKYSIWGKTMSGEICFIKADNHQEFSKYHDGQVVSTYYTTHKKKGEWQWTTSADILFKFWNCALLVMLVWLFVRSSSDQD